MTDRQDRRDILISNNIVGRSAGWRQAGFVVVYKGVEHIGWARKAWTGMRQFSTGGTYVNFLTEDDGEDRIRAAYGDHYDRLVEVKSKWDPDNLFNKNKNIAPG